MDELAKIIQGRIEMSQDPDRREAVRAFDIQSVDIKNRTVEGIASSEIIDRDNEIVSIDALKEAWRSYSKYPVILAAHMHRAADARPTVIGRVVDHRFVGKRLWIKVEFATTSLAEDYWKLYRDGFQRAFSIGFKPWDAATEVVGDKRIPKFTKIDLFEISCVAVGANPEALTKSIRSKDDFITRKRMEKLKKKHLEICREAVPNIPLSEMERMAEEQAWMDLGYDEISGEFITLDGLTDLPDGWDMLEEMCYRDYHRDPNHPKMSRKEYNEWQEKRGEEFYETDEFDPTDEEIEEAEKQLWGEGYPENKQAFLDRLDLILDDDEENHQGETKTVEIPDFAALFDKKKGN